MSSPHVVFPVRVSGVLYNAFFYFSCRSWGKTGFGFTYYSVVTRKGIVKFWGLCSLVWRNCSECSLGMEQALCLLVIALRVENRKMFTCSLEVCTCEKGLESTKLYNINTWQCQYQFSGFALFWIWVNIVNNYNNYIYISNKNKDLQACLLKKLCSLVSEHDWT